MPLGGMPVGGYGSNMGGYNTGGWAGGAGAGGNSNDPFSNSSLGTPPPINVNYAGIGGYNSGGGFNSPNPTPSYGAIGASDYRDYGNTGGGSQNGTYAAAPTGYSPNSGGVNNGSYAPSGGLPTNTYNANSNYGEMVNPNTGVMYNPSAGVADQSNTPGLGTGGALTVN